MLSYKFEIKLKFTPKEYFATEDDLHEHADEVIDALLSGSKLEKEYPDVDFMTKQDVIGGFIMQVIFEWKQDVSAYSISHAKQLMPEAIADMLAGSRLALCKMYNYQLSDEQDGLDEALEWIEDDGPFCIQADASRYHIECAQSVYGKVAVRKAIILSKKYSEEMIIGDEKLFDRYPKDQEGNLLHVVSGYEWKRDFWNAFANAEDLVDSCVCLNSLYDEPRKEQDV